MIHPNNITTKDCNEDEFYETVDAMFNNGTIGLTEDQIKGEAPIFAIGGVVELLGLEVPVIMTNKELIDTMNPEWYEMIVAHEAAHCNGIQDEEEADLWALKYLEGNSRDVLISLWEDRHGHTYEERV